MLYPTEQEKQKVDLTVPERKVSMKAWTYANGIEDAIYVFSG